MLQKLAWRNIWRNKKRSLITIISIALAVVLAVFMRSMQLGMYDNMIKNVVGSYSGYVQVHGKGYWDEQSLDNAMMLSAEDMSAIGSIKGVDNLIQRLQSFTLSSSGELTKGVLLQGVDQKNENNLSDWSDKLVEGRLLNPQDDGIVVGKGVAKYFKIGVGDSLTFLGQGYQGMSAVGLFEIVGIVDLKNPKVNTISVFSSIENVQDFMSAPGLVTNLLIDKDDTADANKIASEISNVIDMETYEVMTWEEMLPEIKQTIQADSAGGILMVFILYMIITFGIFGTILMMTQERIFELGVMVSIGMKKIKLVYAIVLESILLTAIGVVSGALIVMPLVFYFNRNPITLGKEQSEAMEKFGFEAIVPTLTDFSIPLTHGLIIFFISLIITIYPTLVILKLDPIKAMKK